MERTICDRCHNIIEGPVSVFGVWGPDGIFGNGLPKLNGLPAVAMLNLCRQCREEVEGNLKCAPHTDAKCTTPPKTR